MRPTVADIKREILADAQERADMAGWLRRRMGELSDERKSVIAIPMRKRGEHDQ